MTLPTVADRLERVVRRHVLGSLPPDPSGELKAMALMGVLIVYGNWRGRLVSPRPRNVHIARELASELSTSEHAAAVEAVCAEITAGEELTPRLSKDIDVAYVPRAQRKIGGGRDRDIDAMLAHDGLHHLHLGYDQGGRFVKRTHDLLFVAFKDGDAYVVGVYPHGSWGQRELLERIIRNWPRAELLARARSVSALSQEYSDEDRWELMKNGVSVAVEIDGGVFFTPGQTTAGTPLAVTQRAQAFVWHLTEMRERGVDRTLAERGADSSLYWSPAIRAEQAGLESSQGFVPLGRLS